MEARIDSGNHLQCNENWENIIDDGGNFWKHCQTNGSGI
jgi:hypothetical protein